MVAPLVVAAIGLAKQKKDQTEASAEEGIRSWLAYERQQQQHEYETRAAIDAKRASRAGDAGYMQTAMAHALNAPTYNAPALPEDNGQGMRIASGLLAQREADSAEQAAANATNGTNGINWHTPDPDDDLLNPWGT